MLFFFLGVLAAVALDLDDEIQEVILAAAVVDLDDEVGDVVAVFGAVPVGDGEPRLWFLT